MDVNPIPGLEQLPWAEVWFHEIDEVRWREASAAAREIGKPGLDVWTTDATLGFRLPKRRGVLSLGVDNLFDKDFHYQDIDPENPGVVPERFAYFRFTLSF